MTSGPEIERELIPCNLCGSMQHSRWARVGPATIVRCRICGLIFTNPRLPASTLFDSYEEDYGEIHEDPALLAQRRRMYELERADLLRWAQGGRFLDVGCGTGEFLSLLRDDFDVYGLEVSQRYLNLARERYALPHLIAGELADAGLDADFFDVVQLRGVLQHLPDPAAQLAEACRVTKPGGLIVISATPNIASPAARVFKANFRLLAPDHMVYDFSPYTLRRLLENAGYRVERFLFPYVQTPYFRWTQPLEFIGLAAKLAWRQFADRDTQDLKSPAFFRSMMTCVARKP